MMDFRDLGIIRVFMLFEYWDVLNLDFIYDG